MLCLEVILLGRMAPAPPAYILPPQMPSILNEVPYVDILSTVNGSSEMKRAIPTFSSATLSCIWAEACFRLSISDGDRGSMLSRTPLMRGVLPSSDTSDASILTWRQAGLSTERL